MSHAHIERVAGRPEGSYLEDPEGTYIAFQHAAGACLLDQFIPRNPLTMGEAGFDGAERGATTGADTVILDGIEIASPEDVVQHLETVAFPRLIEAAGAFDQDARTREILENEARVQNLVGPSVLKTGYAFVRFPTFSYGTYGYGPYFTAYALYPEVMERHFVLQADLALLNNKAAARAYVEGDLPPLYRLDHDMADSRSTLVDIRSLDRIWFPQFTRCIEPLLDAGVRLVWHCDGNLMAMVPRLIEAGVSGFQGFQYEHGMDYPRICSMRDRWGRSMIIMAGVSVTRTLPFGTPDDVRRELAWLVEEGPEAGLFLGASSSVVPGVPWANMETLIEGLRYYRENGRRS